LIQSRVLENFTALKKITLDAEWSSDLLPYLVCTSVALLKTLKAPQLRIIELVSGFNARTSHRLDETCEIPEWKHLDDVLSGDTFPYLTLVDLTVNLGLGDNHWFRWAYIPPPVAKVREAIQDCLPQTALKGLLRLNVCDYHDWFVFLRNMHYRTLMIPPRFVCSSTLCWLGAVCHVCAFA
jgi:hypothetical protein